MQCKIANTIRSATPKCDCENQGKEVKDNNTTIPSSKVIVHFYLDDYYTVSATVIPPIPFIILAKKKNIIDEAACAENATNLYRPPQC